MNHRRSGHLLALTAILIWGSTFVVTKVLLSHLGPTQILFVRFAAAGLCLLPWTRGFFRWRGRRVEGLWFGAGLFGITAYYLAENTALALASAGEVGLLVSTIPLWTAALVWAGGRERRPTGRWFLGALTALAGIVLIVAPQLSQGRSWLGSGAALGAALAFVGYTALVRRIPAEVPAETTLARMFLWGALLAAPLLGGDEPWPNLKLWFTAELGGALVFLVGAASVGAYAAWNRALASLGPVVTNTYIYTVPVVNTGLAVLVLGEPWTWITGLGCLLIIAGTVGGTLTTGEPARLSGPEKTGETQDCGKALDCCRPGFGRRRQDKDQGGGDH